MVLRMENWNPMEEAYQNKEFNKYETGPGVALAKDFNNSSFNLCLKSVPRDMTEKALRNLCSNYGKVVNVKYLDRSPLVFVSFASLNDMERAFVGLKSNSYGIHVSVGHSRKSNQDNVSESKKEAELPHFNEQIDKSFKTIKDRVENPPRPKGFQQIPFVTEADYESSNLAIVDPDRHFLTPLDMHEQERRFPKDKCEFDKDGRCVYLGRVIYIETSDTEQNIIIQSLKSKGTYYREEGEYIKHFENMSLKSEEITLGRCTLCGNVATKICGRCQDFYCSFECQKKDWLKHKHVCFPMPVLLPLNESVSSTFENMPNIDNLKIKEKTENMLSGNKQVFNGVKSEHEKLPLKESKLNQECTNNKENVNVSNFIRTDDSVKIQNSPEKNTTISSQEYPKNSANPPSQDLAKGPTTTTASQGYIQHHNNTTNANEKSKAIVCVDYPKSGSTVSITAIINPNFVYIRSLAKEDVIDYIKTLSVVNNESQTSKLLTKMPNKGDYVIADFQGSGYYRALVLNAENEDKIGIAYIDFGNTENKKLSELKEFPEKVRHFKRHALPINLKDMPDFSPNEKTTKYLYSFVDCDEKDLKLVYESDAYKASELIDMSTNEVLNKKILELQEVKEPKLSDTPVLSEDIISELIPAGKNVPLYVYDNSFLSHGYISCIHEKDIIPLVKFNQQIRAYASKVNEQYCPRATEICLVKYEEDNLWYRAECLEIKGDKNPTVIFIDYGNITNVHVSNIRKYPKEFTHPCRTSQCLIAQLPKKMTVEALKRLKELIPLNDKILVKEVEKEESSSINVLYMDEVLERLKEEKLI